ncbi:Two-component response regulator, SAPR family, consists of REC, wHTH and BTAD domains [Amphibacillus marinus]|uniref:Two-component response regulator, SAPR family, consists of REC, wHTH and BTAD domains n=1 Tax=Amphibacillus marinus TaxID=872970 RepID=A0A1H8QPM6_9BACI|nr:response regulator [Amphibacillus marinus]SEO56170.1 Two-component response regulator, SAPR family, consists of REC, wHTH and BTAD domains [Amphibacillus marinus]
MNAILVDDEPLALDYLATLLEQTSDIKILHKLTRASVALEVVNSESIDLVFLDIDMPDMNGVELAEQLVAVNPTISVIFVTAYNEFAIDAFEVNALDYLLKPINRERLAKTIDRISRYQKLHVIHNSEETLKISVTNCLTLQIGSGSKNSPSWRTMKTRELFLYLLHKKDKLVKREEIIDLLWANLTFEKAVNQLYTAIYHIRKTLAPYQNCLKIIKENEGYMLATKNIVLDLEDWETNMKKLPPLTEQYTHIHATTLLEYQGHYLDQYNYLWAEDYKYFLQTLWCEHALQLASFFKQKLQWDEAKKWYEVILTYEPEHEEATLQLMKIYAILNDNERVNSLFTRYQKALIESLDTHASKEINNWYKSWRKYH